MASDLSDPKTAWEHVRGLLGRGRRDWDKLRVGARLVNVSGTGVMIASAVAVTALRREHKGTGGE